MKRKYLYRLICTAVLATTATSCLEPVRPIPSSHWYNTDGLPDIVTTDSMTITVYHRTTVGTCPISYPIMTDPLTGRYYIRAAIRIFISYNAETGVLYLSPGGEYISVFTNRIE